MIDVARGVLSELDTDVVLDRLLESARELTGAHYAALGVLDDSRTELAQFITAGIDEHGRRRIGPLPRGRGLLGELIRNPQPLRLADLEEHPRSYGFPLGHPPMKSFLGVPVLIKGEPFGNVYLTDKNGGVPFTEDDEQALVALADFAGVAIDHARRFSGSETRRRELQRTVDALDASLEISRALGGETNLDTILALVAKRGRALVSARALVIELRRGEEFVVSAGAGELPPDIVDRTIPLEGTVAGAALRTRETQDLSDELNRARFDQYGAGRLGFRADSGLFVPLMFRGRAYGVLAAIDRLTGGPEFTSDDRRLLEAFASSAATAVATAQAMADERSSQRLAAADQERARWARELHDETLQGLGALKIGLEVARQVGDPETLAQATRDAVAGLDAEISGLRSLITDLRPAVLDQLGTGAAIRALAERLEGHGVQVDLAVDLAYEGGRQDERHATELETAVYRIVQEALTNARKHGEAKRAIVEVIENEYEIHITIRDDGNGFDVTASTSGFGLLGMRERADLLGGTLAVESSPGEGTTVTSILPVRRRGDMSFAGAPGS